MALKSLFWCYWRVAELETAMQLATGRTPRWHRILAAVERQIREVFAIMRGYQKPLIHDLDAEWLWRREKMAHLLWFVFGALAGTVCFTAILLLVLFLASKR